MCENHHRVLLVWRSDSDRVRARKTRSKHRIGVQDICGTLVDGRSFFFEIKRPKGSVRRPKQEDFILKAQAAKVVAAFVSSVFEAKALLEDIK